MRIACIYIQNFYFKSETLRQPSLRNEMVLIYSGDHSKRHVVDVSGNISSKMIGEGLDFAMEHYPYAILCKADFLYYQEEFRKILDRIYSKTDRFQTEELGTVYVDLQDLRRVFNNDAAIATSLLNTVPYTMSPRIGISVGKFPALIIARRAESGHARFVFDDVRKTIASISVDLLPVSRDIKYQLRSFGLSTLGDVARIPSPGLQAQFGKIGFEIAQLSRGIDTSPVIPEKMPVPVDASVSFDIPVSNTEVITWGISNLLSKILLHSEVRGKSIAKMTLGGVCLGGYRWHQKIIFKSLVNRHEDLMEQILAKFKILKLPNPVEDLYLTVDVLEIDQGTQKTLFTIQNDNNAKLRRSIQTIKASQGENPIHLIKKVDVCSKIPERRWAMVTYDF